MEVQEALIEATKAALDEVAGNFKAEQEGRQKLTEDLLYRMLEREKEFKRRLMWLLPSVAAIQLIILLALFTFVF